MTRRKGNEKQTNCSHKEITRFLSANVLGFTVISSLIVLADASDSNSGEPRCFPLLPYPNVFLIVLHRITDGEHCGPLISQFRVPRNLSYRRHLEERCWLNDPPRRGGDKKGIECWQNVEVACKHFLPSPISSRSFLNLKAPSARRIGGNKQKRIVSRVSWEWVICISAPLIPDVVNCNNNETSGIYSQNS